MACQIGTKLPELQSNVIHSGEYQSRHRPYVPSLFGQYNSQMPMPPQLLVKYLTLIRTRSPSVGLSRQLAMQAPSSSPNALFPLAPHLRLSQTACFKPTICLSLTKYSTQLSPCQYLHGHYEKKTDHDRPMETPSSQHERPATTMVLFTSRLLGGIMKLCTGCRYEPREPRHHQRRGNAVLPPICCAHEGAQRVARDRTAHLDIRHRRFPAGPPGHRWIGLHPGAVHTGGPFHYPYPLHRHTNAGCHSHTYRTRFRQALTARPMPVLSELRA